jgi:DNA-binding NtrC family response regulator
MNALQNYDWHGNVRELRNALEGIVVLSRKEAINSADLPLDILGDQGPGNDPLFPPGDHAVGS